VLNKPAWSKAHVGSVEPTMRRGVLPVIGDRDIAQITREPVQAALNHMAEMELHLGVKNKHTRLGYGERSKKLVPTRRQFLSLPSRRA
jgi:hypothetical protein